MEKGVGRELQTVTDMDEHGEMKQEVYNLAAYAIEQFVTEVEISKHIKVSLELSCSSGNHGHRRTSTKSTVPLGIVSSAATLKLS